MNGEPGSVRNVLQPPAKCTNWPLAEAERWLAPILNYEPAKREVAA